VEVMRGYLFALSPNDVDSAARQFAAAVRRGALRREQSRLALSPLARPRSLRLTSAMSATAARVCKRATELLHQHPDHARAASVLAALWSAALPSESPAPALPDVNIALSSFTLLRQRLHSLHRALADAGALGHVVAAGGNIDRDVEKESQVNIQVRLCLAGGVLALCRFSSMLLLE
jgi:hypothetical protein